uniref:Cilia- and flagella-associated protein 97 n=1 Tax=Globisporangium ultimum (strain ATCC 200006 / CBS 805.95 / DAOM BR144) TaxID=431595 RepID=K3WRK6_GLOUD
MDRGRKAIPTLNKHTDSKYYQKCQEIHRSKLNTIKSSIDNSEPHRPTHLKKNLKKEQMKEERYAEIERENRILLEKMSHIMQNETLDNKNQSIVYSHSLNKGLRKRELQKITSENQAILRRIQMREPTYDHVQWEEEAKKNERYAANIREYTDDPQNRDSTGELRAMSAYSMAGAGGNNYY